MSSSGFSPIRVVFGIAVVSAAIFLLLTMFPTLTVKPATTNDPRAAFGMMFNLTNNGLAVIRDVSSTICVNSAAGIGGTQPAAGGAQNFGATNQPLGLSDLNHGDVVALPFEGLKPGPPGSTLDLVFVIRFEPGPGFWQEERRFRFSGTEASDRTWTWQSLSPGGVCQ